MIPLTTFLLLLVFWKYRYFHLSTMFHLQHRLTNPALPYLSRFSKDVAELDELLPYGFIESIQAFLSVTSIIVLSIAVNYWVSLAGVPLMVSFVCLRRYVLRSTKDLKRLERRYRCDAVSHCSSTLSGLTCIRAFKTQERFLQRFYEWVNIYWHFLLNTLVQNSSSECTTRLDFMSFFEITVRTWFVIWKELIHLSESCC